MKDNEIIELYFQRNENAVEQTKKQYGSYLQRIAENILSVRQDAEECVSDVYLTAWNSIPPQKPQSLKAWLGRVVRNRAIDMWRANNAHKRYGGIELIIGELEQCIPETGNSLTDTIDEKYLGQLISSWLRTLEQTDRQIFIDRYWYGCSLTDIAKNRKLSYGMLNSRIYRLRLSLKEYLESEDVNV